MAGLDILSEAVVDAAPTTVYAALTDYTPPMPQWWMPTMEVQPQGEIGAELVGGVIKLLPRRPRGPALTLRIVEARDNELLRYDYIGGLVVGQGTLTLTPVDGRTQVSYRFQVQARRGFMRPFHPVFAWGYKRSMIAFFAGLKEHLSQQCRT